MKKFCFMWLFAVFICFFTLTSGQPSDHDHNNTLICLPFGTCEPCPEDALHEPFCQPFGNRRLVHCRPAPPPPDTPLDHSRPSRPPSFEHAPHPEGHQGETPAWESCGRIVEKERADFYEFLACNFGLAVVALLVMFARSKRLQAMHARQLAARIGLVRGQ